MILGLVVKGEDLQPRGREFESRLRILDGMKANCKKINK